MTKTELKALLDHLGIAPSKKLGQNFLIDAQFLDWIVREARIQPGENVLEVGPGLGALTRGLLSAGARVVAIEFDRKLAAYLRSALSAFPLRLIEGDACRTDCATLFDGEPFRIVSNLPYSAGTVFVAKTLDMGNPPSSMTLMLQKEVAERFCAAPGTEQYSALSVRIQALYDVRILRLAPPELFYPRPDVDSAVLSATLKNEAARPDRNVLAVLSRLARTAFAHRRKKMFRQIAAVFGEAEVRAAMESAGIDPDVRAERVPVEKFLQMAGTLVRGI